MVAGQSKIGGRPCSPDIQVFVEQRRIFLCQTVNTDKEHRFELQSFYVLDVEYAYVGVLPNNLSL